MSMIFHSVERRREPRFVVETAASVIGGKGRTQAGTIVDISDHGLGLSVSQAPCRKGGSIQVCIQRAVITGWLKYCRKNGSVYAAGVELEHRLDEGQVRALIADFVARYQ